MTEEQRNALGHLASDAMTMSTKQGDMMRIILQNGFNAKLTQDLTKNLTIQQELCSNFYNMIDEALDKN